ncbi:MAG: M48 family metalloprotease [Candidatus Omnitrophica bacterium]|nr:M48 family metalloprotease [Candidatus Omnitrophota bacterium]MBL7210328.1 M48 family metalloprotease [Candidatus Omnitrophota bacterium]
MFWLRFRMWLLMTLLFAIIYAVITMVGTYLGMGNFYFYLIFAMVMMFVQYMLGPKMVEWSMRVKYARREDYPEVFRMVEEMAIQAKMPMPKIGIAQIQLPNAFAFGRGPNDGRVCVTQGILKLLDEQELRAVLGHELSHLKNRDVLTITLLSVVPMVMYYLAWQFLFYGRRRSQGGANTALIGMAAFFFYFITNLLVLYASRIREYFADRGSVTLGNRPAALASSLYKLVYGSARMNKESLKEVEGLKAFFLNDPSRGLKEIRELAQLDLDKSGTIDSTELQQLRQKNIRLSFGDRMLEALSTHPNMLKRIKRLSEYKA